MAAASADDEILLSKLKEFIPEKRPSYIKVILVNLCSSLNNMTNFRQSANGIRDWLTLTVTCLL